MNGSVTGEIGQRSGFPKWRGENLGVERCALNSRKCSPVTLLDRLERHLSRFAIPHLIRYVVVLNALVFILLSLDPKYLSVLVLDGDAIVQGRSGAS